MQAFNKIWQNRPLEYNLHLWTGLEVVESDTLYIKFTVSSAEPSPEHFCSKNKEPPLKDHSQKEQRKHLWHCSIYGRNKPPEGEYLLWVRLAPEGLLLVPSTNTCIAEVSAVPSVVPYVRTHTHSGTVPVTAQPSRVTCLQAYKNVKWTLKKREA